MTSTSKVSIEDHAVESLAWRDLIGSRLQIPRLDLTVALLCLGFDVKHSSVVLGRVEAESIRMALDHFLSNRSVLSYGSPHATPMQRYKGRYCSTQSAARLQPCIAGDIGLQNLLFPLSWTGIGCDKLVYERNLPCIWTHSPYG